LNASKQNPGIKMRVFRTLISLLFVAGAFSGQCVVAQTTTPPASSQTSLKKLSVEELMDVEVTSVSRRPEKLSETASAVQVITSEDIRRSGATSLPEVLRLASNLHVAQVDSSQWAISARGFNNTTANKMLVLIDGRSVYTPLHAGVFWDIQNVLLEDIDRIEVISGSGATLWGANAVNGVISITTRHASDTHGLFIESGGGTQPRGFTSVRYGGQFSSNGHYRVYGKIFERERSLFSNANDANNEWHLGQGGFRIDWRKSTANAFTVQGDVYDGQLDQITTHNIDIKGGNLLARWSHTFAGGDDLNLQLYYDRTHRAMLPVISEDLTTYDVDFQHRFRIGDSNQIIWGLGYRQIHDDILNPPTLAFLPAQVTRRRYSGFLQGEIAVVKNRIDLTLGTKIEHNDYTGFEFQPSARMTWKLDRRQMAWGAVSRAVRTPSRFDRELFIPERPPFLLAGGPDFESEDSLSYEFGYRAHARDRVSLSVASFYDDYTNLRSVEQLKPPLPFPLQVGNGLKGESYGVEVTGDYYVNDWWRLHGGFTEMRIHIRPELTSTDRSNGSAESHDPNRRFMLRSSIDPLNHVQFDSIFRYVSEIRNQQLPGYAEMDLRLSWQPKSSLEFSVVGQNLLHDKHAEFGSPATRQEIERSVYGKVAWRFLNH
jgi:iron complex outermembrane recepter protein